MLSRFLILLSFFFCLSTTAEQKPNIIYLMLDEWGYFETSHMMNDYLITPNIDQFAAEGMQFTNAYAGAPVCGPTRCVLLTGKHSGHTSVPSNNGYAAIRKDEITLGSMLKKKGYVTGGFGKWGIGARGTSGIPEKHGFDEFFGYYDQVHAHTYFPKYLIHTALDFYPILLELAGIKKKEDKILDGESFVELLHNQKPKFDPKRPLVWLFPIYVPEYAFQNPPRLNHSHGRLEIASVL